MKLNFAIILLPAASAFVYSGFHHHHHGNQTKSLIGTAPYGSGNGTSTFGSSGLLTVPTGTAGKAVYSTVVITNDGPYHTVVESAPVSLSEAGASLPVPSSCAQGTVTVTTNATVTVTIPAPESGKSVIPTQAPVPTEAGTSSPIDLITSAFTKTSSITPLPAASSATTLAAIGGEPSSSTSTPAVADTSATVAVVPVAAPTSSSSSTVTAAATPVTAPKDDGGAASSADAPAATSSGKAAKRGIIVSGQDTDAIAAAFANTKVSWLGNWYSGPPPNLTPEMGMEYVPQLYRPQSALDGSWASNAKKGVAAGDKYFMSYGEPETSHLDVQAAVDDWMKNMEPYAAQGIGLGSPGNLQNPKDMEWTANFLDLCEKAGCTVSFVCVHWFWTPGPNGQQDFQHAVNNATALAKGKPVWVDNFGANGDRAGQIEFLTNMIPWLEDNDSVARYGYLAINRTQGGFLPETGDELSDLGKFYATF